MAKYVNQIENKVVSNMEVKISGEAEIMKLEQQLQNTTAEVDRLNAELSESAARIASLNSELSKARSASGIAALQNELSRFKQTASEAAMEFDAFLRASRLTDVNGYGFGEFEHYFRQIEEGSLTAQQAIVRVKHEYANLFNEGGSGAAFDSATIQQFDATLNSLGSTIKEVLTRVTEIQTQGVAVNGQFASSGTTVASTLQQIEAAARGMDEDLIGSYEAIAKLTTALREYSAVDEGKLISISDTFRSMAKVGEGNFGSKSLQNLIDFFNKIQMMGDGSGTLRLQITGNFDQLSGLKTSKTWGEHLTSLGNALKAINISKLQQLAAIDFSNLSNFKLSKSSTENLLGLANTMKQIEEMNAKIQALGNATGLNFNTTPSAQQMSGASAAATEYATATATAAAGINELTKQTTTFEGETDNVVSTVTQFKNAVTGAVTTVRAATDEEGNLVATSTQVSQTYKTAAQAAKEAASAEKAAADARRESANVGKDVASQLNQIATQERNLIKNGGQDTTLFGELAGYKTRLDELFETYNQTGDYAAFKTGLVQLQTDFINTKTAVADYTAAVKEANAAQKQAAAADAAAKKEAEAAALREAAEAEQQKTQAAKEAASAEKAAAKAELERIAQSKERANALKQYQTILSQIRAAERNYSAAAKSNNATSRNAYGEIQKQAMAMESLCHKYQSGTISYGDFVAGCTAANAKLTENTTIIKNNGDATKTLSERLTGLAGKFGAWLSVSQMIMYSIRAVRDMISSSIELDDAMSQLKIVTNETDAAYQNFASSVSKTAQEIGASAKDLIDATTTYARLGYNLDESSALARYTGMLQQVGAIESQDAQDAITSMIKAFDIEVDEIESVMDRLVAVGNGAPISVSQIAEAMTNASSTMAAAGNDLNQTIALMTAANTTLQNASRSSTGLRTITARIRKTKTELDDLGEAMSDSDYEELVSALSKITLKDGTTTSVSLTDINGEYRETYEIMADIAAVWDELDSMSQAGITEKLAGKLVPERTEMCA